MISQQYGCLKRTQAEYTNNRHANTEVEISHRTPPLDKDLQATKEILKVGEIVLPLE